MNYKKSKCQFSEKFWIERDNNLNQLRPKGMTLNEIRFLAIYQSKINAREPDKREVIFPLNDFVEFMSLQRLNITKLKNTIDDLLKHIVHIPNNRNGFISIPLFCRSEVYQDEVTGEWSIKIKCSEEILPYMFQMKKNYFKYQLWNALRLTSVNQIRMYEILKQYEKAGTRIIALDELKEMLGLEKKQYTRFEAFNRRVLEPCQQSLEENTDIKFTYAPIRTSKKITAIQFDISKNENYKDVLKISKFIKSDDLNDIENDIINVSDINMPIYSEPRTLKDLYRKYFTDEQFEQFEFTIKSHGINNTDIILKNALSALEEQMSQKKINSKIKYITNIINNMIDEECKPKFKSKAKSKIEKKKNQSYDIERFEDFAINGDELKKVYDEVFKDIMEAGFITADYETALKILKDNKEYKDFPKDKFEFIENQMESKKQAAEMLANI